MFETILKMKSTFLVCFGLICVFGSAQVKPVENVFAAVDSLYREDQFYLGLTYNRLLRMPTDMTQNGLSIGISAGFLRDFPINKSRTIAVAIGFGFYYNKFHQNMLVSAGPTTFEYKILDNSDYDRNKFEQGAIEIPIEIRWRNATATRHRFFRIYGGFKFSYVAFNKTKFVGTMTETTINNNDFNKLQYGPSLSLGYNTWNLHAFYGMNPTFKSAAIGSENIRMSTLGLGLMFYVL